jgi:hypothetical protein
MLAVELTAVEPEFCSKSRPMYCRSACLRGSGEFIDRLMPNGRQLPV